MTAGEYISKKFPINTEGVYVRRNMEESMIEFAQIHVDLALKRAHTNMQLPLEDLDFTLEAYPLDNIK